MISIRKLEKKDNNHFAKLIAQDFFNYQEFIKKGWSIKEINNQFNKISNVSYGIFDKDLMVSFIFGDLINIEKNSEYEILLIYVGKHYRNKGLGSKLIKQIEENCNCLKNIHLEVSESNLTGILFYKKMGFKKMYTRKNYFSVQNRKIDALVMAKNY